ncbi:hypothetical protein HYH03_006145 [Edaphochlamys debaryana]|uniref:Uncharacterized protein n=1 Tax=Edaphochlamys debaryana TaxID=47281 RepID=A0A835Y704_9CHLO|nr:hypothetical protein HYH03_006145 [Edaphochlamys debaryana]|eukprot:KAG2495908.1 hypothetical protein HYH03_006145 [Edaphochlamys debaryana]
MRPEADPVVPETPISAAEVMAELRTMRANYDGLMSVVGTLSSDMNSFKQSIMDAITAAMAPFQQRLQGVETIVTAMQKRLEGLEERLGQQEARSSTGGGGTGNGSADGGCVVGTGYRDRVKLVVTPALNDSQLAKNVIEETLRKGGAAVTVDVVQMRKGPAKGGATQAGHQGRAEGPSAAAQQATNKDGKPLLVAYFNPASWSAIMRCWKQLKEAGVEVKDFLTKEGMVLREKRVATYLRLQAERKQVGAGLRPVHPAGGQAGAL